MIDEFHRNIHARKARDMMTILLTLVGLGFGLGFISSHLNFIGLHAALHLKGVEELPLVLRIERWAHLEHHRVFSPSTTQQNKKWAPVSRYLRRLPKELSLGVRQFSQFHWSAMHLIIYLRGAALFSSVIIFGIVRGEHRQTILEASALVLGYGLGFFVYSLVLVLHHNWIHAGGPSAGWHLLHHREPKRAFGLWKWCDFRPNTWFLRLLLTEVEIVERYLIALRPDLETRWRTELETARTIYQSPSITEPQ